MISGTTVVTGQLRHKTITDTHLDQPDRSHGLAAKVIVADLTGTLSGLLAAAITTAAATGFTAARGWDKDSSPARPASPRQMT
jgi:ABC-2 type transport system permease protein